MSIETLKKEIVATIDATQDEMLLQNVMDILSNRSFNEVEKK